jgi:hypothetical protein
MGTEALWVPLVLSAVGAGASAIDQRQMARKRDAIAVQGIDAQARRRREAEARVNQEVQAAARSSPEAEQQQAMADFTSQLRASKAGAAGTTDIAGASDRYQTDTTAAKAGIENYGQQMADITSRITAQGRQRQREGFSRGRASSDVAGISRNAQGDEFLNQLMQSRVHPNAGLGILSALASGAGSAMAGRAGAGEGFTGYPGGTVPMVDQPPLNIRIRPRPIPGLGTPAWSG